MQFLANLVFNCEFFHLIYFQVLLFFFFLSCVSIMPVGKLQCFCSAIGYGSPVKSFFHLSFSDWSLNFSGWPPLGRDCYVLSIFSGFKVDLMKYGRTFPELCSVSLLVFVMLWCCCFFFFWVCSLFGLQEQSSIWWDHVTLIHYWDLYYTCTLLGHVNSDGKLLHQRGWVLLQVWRLCYLSNNVNNI